jgi:hypothetical protein
MNPISPIQKEVPTPPEQVARLFREEEQMNKSRRKLNQPPTGEGKKQRPESGQANKLNKRAEVLQAAGAEQNIGSAEEEEAYTPNNGRKNPLRPKAGR